MSVIPFIKRRLLVAVVLLSALFSVNSYAVPANPNTTLLRQPDGVRFRAVQRGDEWLNWVETDEGYTIARDTDGFWYYVTQYRGKTPVLDFL